MTNASQLLECESPDRPDELDEVKITPQMEEAGFAVLYSSGIADDYLEADRQIVQRILLRHDSHSESGTASEVLNVIENIFIDRETKLAF